MPVLSTGDDEPFRKNCNQWEALLRLLTPFSVSNVDDSTDRFDELSQLFCKFSYWIQVTFVIVSLDFTLLIVHFVISTLQYLEIGFLFTLNCGTEKNKHAASFSKTLGTGSHKLLAYL